MAPVREWALQSRHGGERYVRVWANAQATWIALLSHGYGEHISRYDYLAEALTRAGATVLGPDHEGHGRSDGERALIQDFESVIDDLHDVAMRAVDEQPGLPMVLIGHSMGGMIAGRYVQRYEDELAALVLSGPMFGTRELLIQLLAMDPIPEISLDPNTLSRDPDVGAAYAHDSLVWHGAFKRPTLEASMATMDRVASGPHLKSLPMLWIHGESDTLVPVAQTRPMINHLGAFGFQEQIYSGAMHEVFNETNKNEVIGDVITFIKTVLAEPTDF